MDDVLMHYGLKGMHWGVRRFQDSSGQLTDAGKRRYSIQAARKYYKINRLQRAQEKTRDPDKSERLAKRIRRVETRQDRKVSDLSKNDINIGREIVAKNRRNMAVAGTVAKGAATAAGIAILANNPNTRWAVPIAAAAGTAATVSSAKKLPYYHMENRRYKQVNPKGATKKGQSKAQSRLKKAAKVAGTAAAIAGTAALVGYTSKKMQKNKAWNDAYTNASEATRAIMDANRQYRQGRRIRKTVDRATTLSKTGAKKAMQIATSNKTKDTIRKAATTSKKALTSDRAKNIYRTTGRGIAKTATGIGNITRGFMGANDSQYSRYYKRKKK